MESLINAWQHLPSHMIRAIFSIGSFQLRYYSLMYLVAFAIVYFLVLYRIKHENYKYTAETIQDYLIWAMIGVIIGGRLGYALFYNFDYYFQHPLEIILPFDFSHGITLSASAECLIMAVLSALSSLPYYFAASTRFNSGVLAICSVRQCHWATPLAGSAILSTVNFSAA